ncbi:hypothetical protein [Paenibacillus sp. IHBB 3054]|uniref:hypothetical protein n=1 Tax=Paenibacillus sp. IHBB 3054 TaxID=3425689 RepID=UPI003F670BDF
MEGIDIPLLAANTEFFSGADIENLCESAAEQVLEEILETGVELPIRMSDVEAVLQEVRPSTMEWLRIKTGSLKSKRGTNVSILEKLSVS